MFWRRLRNFGLNFYPRSPCGERLFGMFNNIIHPNFYPRSPCGERQLAQFESNSAGGISIHALLAESDFRLPASVSTNAGFLSTLSLRRATAPCRHHSPHRTISIHALLAESDISRYTARPLSSYFYPRSPCGERRCQEKFCF